MAPHSLQINETNIGAPEPFEGPGIFLDGVDGSNPASGTVVYTYVDVYMDSSIQGTTALTATDTSTTFLEFTDNCKLLIKLIAGTWYYLDHANNSVSAVTWDAWTTFEAKDVYANTAYDLRINGVAVTAVKAGTGAVYETAYRQTRFGSNDTTRHYLVDNIQYSYSGWVSETCYESWFNFETDISTVGYPVLPQFLWNGRKDALSSSTATGPGPGTTTSCSNPYNPTNANALAIIRYA